MTMSSQLNVNQSATELSTVGSGLAKSKPTKSTANVLSSHNNDPQPPLNCRGMSFEQNDGHGKSVLLYCRD